MNNIHSSVILEGRVHLGENNVILPNTIIIGPVEIGDNNIIGPNVVVGTPAQDTRTPRYDASESMIRIGNNNIIREFSGIHKPLYTSLTEINNDIYIMQGSVINHDCLIMDKVVIASNVAIAGLVKVMTGAYLAQGVNVAQRTIIGAYSILAMGSPIIKNVPPFLKYIPNRKSASNDYAIEKFGFEDFKADIHDYILNGRIPESEEVKNIILKFESLHAESGNKIYR